MMFADLHMHTSFSDGTYSPEELAGHGHRCKLSAMALTDHDTVEGCERMDKACRSLGIEFISGTELTAELYEDELHLLGYFLDIHNPRLLSEISKFQHGRQERIREMVARLNAHKIPLRAEDVFKLANCKSPGRPHVGRALVRGGFCTSMDEAFERFLKKNRPAYVPKLKISAHHAIELIHDAGGLAIMAHPGLNRTDDFIKPLVDAGLDGIECFHSKHSSSDSQRYLKFAETYNLLITGGSDCHGMSKGKPLIGGVKLPYEYVKKMKARKAAADQRKLIVQSSISTPQ
jgi:predicted metal-dependent phosphoesterase TrpH